MILAVNIGNTHIRCAGGTLKKYNRWVVPVDKVSGSEDFKRHLLSKTKNIEYSIIASVVPDKTEIVAKAIEDITGATPRFIDVTQCGIDISSYGVTLGQDRAVCAAAASLKYPPPLVVIDFGTATTVNVIDENKVFLGGAILPGLQMSLRALSEKTAQLPALENTLPPHSIGRNTNECLISGAVIGTVFAIEGYVNRIGEELGSRPAVIITGGNAPLLLPYFKFDYIHEPDLVIDGLFYIQQECEKRYMTGGHHEKK